MSGEVKGPWHSSRIRVAQRRHLLGVYKKVIVSAVTIATVGAAAAINLLIIFSFARS